MRNILLVILSTLLVTIMNAQIDPARFESYRPTTDDWEITRVGENLEIREPEQSNKIWARFNDDQSLQLIGTPNLLIPGNIRLKGATDSYAQITGRASGQAYEGFFRMSDSSGKYLFQIQNGGGAIGTSWFPNLRGETIDKAPALYLLGINKGDNTNGRGVIVFDAQYSTGAVPVEKKAIEFVSGWGKTLVHINGDGSLVAKGNIESQAIIKATEIIVEAKGNTADFVFYDTYQLKDLTEVENFIKTNKHLPDIPSAEVMEKQGVNLAEMNKLLLQKVEELTLYTITQEQKLFQKDKEVQELQEEKNNLDKRLSKIEALLMGNN